MKSSIQIAMQALVLTAVVTGPLPATAATDNGTLTVGQVGGGLCGGWVAIIHSGFDSFMGSYAPIGLTGGKSVSRILDTFPPPCTSQSVLSVSGFSSNPGVGWLASITCNGVTNSTGAIFSYHNGVASWGWAQKFGFTPMSPGTNVSCSIVHN